MKPLGPHLTCDVRVMMNHFLHWKWFMVAVIVGSVLNVINQFEALQGLSSVNYLKLVVTYLVPYCVSSISAWFSFKA